MNATDYETPHVMLDIETLGTGPNAAIIAIGAVWFNPLRQDTVEELLRNNKNYYQAITIDSCLLEGFDIDAKTFEWWKHQSTVAKAQVFGRDDSVSIKTAITDFLGKLKPENTLWGNGVSFDNVILKNAADRLRIEFPVGYQNWMCMRTMKNIFNVDFEASGSTLKKPFSFDEPAWAKDAQMIPHFALHDAACQASHVQSIFYKLITNFIPPSYTEA